MGLLGKRIKTGKGNEVRESNKVFSCSKSEHRVRDFMVRSETVRIFTQFVLIESILTLRIRYNFL